MIDKSIIVLIVCIFDCTHTVFDNKHILYSKIVWLLGTYTYIIINFNLIVRLYCELPNNYIYGNGYNVYIHA